MKFIMITLALIVLSIALYSNPITAEIVSEFWFSNEGHLMMEFCMNYNYNDQPVNLSDIHLVNDAMDVTIPLAGAVSAYPYVVDVSSLIPGFTLNPEVDTLLVYFDNSSGFAGSTYYRWGNCPYSRISSISPGQSAVRVHTSDGFVLAKDEPPTPGASPYSPIARDTLIIMVTNQFGEPMSGVPVLLYNLYYTNYTDINGIFTVTTWASRCGIIVRHPQTNEIVYQQSHILEPNETTVIPVTISITANEDELIPVPIKGLHVYPSPFNHNTADAITFKYDGETKLSRDTYFRLYDTKGRFILQIPMDIKGMASWKPASDIASGLYFARLISGNRIVDSTPISIIK